MARVSLLMGLQLPIADYLTMIGWPKSRPRDDAFTSIQHGEAHVSRLLELSGRWAAARAHQRRALRDTFTLETPPTPRRPAFGHVLSLLRDQPDQRGVRGSV